MNILITGGAGFIGSNLALTLQKEHNITILDDFSSGSFENIKGFSGNVISGDIRSTRIKTQLEGIDMIIHLAAITDTTVMDERLMMDVNLEGFRNILNSAVEKGIKRVVYASSAGVYGNGAVPMKEDQQPSPMNVYAYSKLAMENLAGLYTKKFGIICVGLRFFNVYGPRERHKGKYASMVYQLMQQMKSGKNPRIFYDGEQKRDFIYVDDVVLAIKKAMEYPHSDIFNVGTGKVASFNQIIEYLNRALSTNLSPEYFENPYSFYQNHTEADVNNAKEKLDFSAVYTPEEGIKKYVDTLKQLYGE